MTQQAEGSWYKLKDDSWGVKIRFAGSIGDTVVVTNSKGDSKTVVLAERAAKFDDAELWRIS